MNDRSNLADDARARTGQPGPRCTVETFLKAMNQLDRRIVESILVDRGLTNTGVARALQSTHGLGVHTPSVWSISNHRAGKCRCHR